MKFALLKQIVLGKAHALRESAGYNGDYGDGGSANLIRKIEQYQQRLVVKYDLRPSEFSTLDGIEVGEPEEFESIIQSYKLDLAKDLVNKIKL